jgi:polysaccharide export outer membrane protein
MAAGATFRPGDMFMLRMTGMPVEYANAYSLDFTIGGDGFVNIPLGGQVRAAGLTQSQLERAIEKKLIDEQIFRWPTATINVSPSARFVTIGGNVRQANRLQWTADLTLLSAISACGGPGDFAGDRVNLVRSGQIVTYSFKKLKRNPADDPRLNPGDSVDLQ